MIVGENRIRDITSSEKQIIYDALYYYMNNEHQMGRSKHFAADIHADIAKQTSRLLVQIVEAWEGTITK